MKTIEEICTRFSDVKAVITLYPQTVRHMNGHEEVRYEVQVEDTINKVKVTGSTPNGYSGQATLLQAAFINAYEKLLKEYKKEVEKFQGHIQAMS